MKLGRFLERRVQRAFNVLTKEPRLAWGMDNVPWQPNKEVLLTSDRAWWDCGLVLSADLLECSCQQFPKQSHREMSLLGVDFQVKEGSHFSLSASGRTRLKTSATTSYPGLESRRRRVHVWCCSLCATRSHPWGTTRCTRWHPPRPAWWLQRKEDKSNMTLWWALVSWFKSIWGFYYFSKYNAYCLVNWWPFSLMKGSKRT